MPKVMIATPAYGEIFYAPYVQSVLALARLAHKDKWDFLFESISYAEVSEARNSPVASSHAPRASASCPASRCGQLGGRECACRVIESPQYSL